MYSTELQDYVQENRVAKVSGQKKLFSLPQDLEQKGRDGLVG